MFLGCLILNRSFFSLEDRIGSNACHPASLAGQCACLVGAIGEQKVLYSDSDLCGQRRRFELLVYQHSSLGYAVFQPRGDFAIGQIVEKAQ